MGPEGRIDVADAQPQSLGPGAIDVDEDLRHIGVERGRCDADLRGLVDGGDEGARHLCDLLWRLAAERLEAEIEPAHGADAWNSWRSEGHTSELQSLMRISYAVFCL